MLSSLYIKDLAIIDEINFDFQNGLNIITGETGSGKTLIIKAIQLLLGKRFSNEMLRTGSVKIIIEGKLIIENKKIIIRRIFNKNGKSKSFINNEPVKQKDLVNYTAKFVDFHGQHDHQNLLNVDTHLQYLDAYGNYDQDLNKIKLLFNNLQLLEDKLVKLKNDQKDFDEKHDLYNLQFKELSLLPISIEYEKNISDRHKLLTSSENIKLSINKAKELFDGNTQSIIDKLNQIQKIIKSISMFDQKLENIEDMLSSNIIDLEDMYNVITEFSESIAHDHDEMEKINFSITHIEALKRKYGGSIASALNYFDNLKIIKNNNKNYNAEIHKIEQEISLIRQGMNKCALILSKKRHKNAIELEICITEYLSSLGMENTIFKIKLNKLINLINDKGFDECQFYISSNLGEELKPLTKIISGGEVSRIMLAIKMAFQENDMISTLIFDEIDVGISGVVAEKVGILINKLSRSHQILCITHLSQIASKGRYHYKIHKSIIEDRSLVSIKKLTSSERLKEIAGLISGTKITETGYKQAQTLLIDG